jgi:hypothetical protein
MPGRKPYEAFGAFVGPLTSALSCVATAKYAVSPDGKNEVGQVHTLFLTGTDNDGYLRLAGDTGLELRARIYYEIITDDRPEYGPYRITTRGYDYSLRTSDGSSVLDYHWHPLSRSHEKAPHLHLGQALLRPDAVAKKKDHVATGRITFEAVVKQAIEWGVRPRFQDYEQRLASTEERHVLHRSWATAPPPKPDESRSCQTWNGPPSKAVEPRSGRAARDAWGLSPSRGPGVGRCGPVARRC